MPLLFGLAGEGAAAAPGAGKIIMDAQAAMAVMAVDALARVAVALPGGVGVAVVVDARGVVAAKMALLEPQGPTEPMQRQAPQVQQVVFQVAGGFPVGRVLRVEMAREVAAAKGEAVAQGRGVRSVRMELERAAVAVGVAVVVEQAARAAGAAAPAMGSSWSAMVPPATS
jgi:hypothetical protein